MTARFIVADVFDGLATLETGSVDLVITSPPFLALRSYLPAEHPDKSKEIGSEATPAEFIDVLLNVTAELRRVLAPHGSICVELGDTYAGGGGENNLYTSGYSGYAQGLNTKRPPGQNITRDLSSGWPLAKSRTLIPSLYQIALAYGFNPLTGQQSPAGQWRIRNVITWARPNPPVGALGDKWRPATSDLVIACTSGKRYWDDLATRKALADSPGNRYPRRMVEQDGVRGALGANKQTNAVVEPSTTGAPLLDYWVIPPGGYSGSVATEWKRPVDRRESVGDIRRTTSSDCPEHGDQAGPPATGSHDELESVAQSPHNSDSGSYPVQGQLDDSVPTDQTTELVTEASSSDSLDQPYVPVAKPRSKASNRTGLAPATNPPGKPSEETSSDNAGRPTSPLSDVHYPDTAENRTSEDGSVGSPASQTPFRTPDSDILSEPCTCSYYVLETKYTSHYAVFPEELVVPCIQAMCPQRVCRTCGEPSRRIVRSDRVEYRSEERLGLAVHIKERRQALGITSDEINGWFGFGEIAKNWERTDPYGARIPSADVWPTLKERLGLSDLFDSLIEGERAWSSTESLIEYEHVSDHPSGWTQDADGRVYQRLSARKNRIEPEPGWTDCGHDNYRPGLILDPFAGSGTTLAVATGHGHDAIGIDIDSRNADLARDRVGPFLFETVDA